MENKVNKFLESLGLNKNEIKVYLDLLRYSGSSALEISKRTGIHRSNTYDSIRKLINMGFVSEIVDEKKKIFVAMRPNKIKDYLKSQESEVEQVLPYLKSISCDKNNDEDEVKINNGIFAAREALFDLLKNKSDILSYAIPPKAINVLGEWFFDDFHKNRVKNKINMKMIFDEYPIEKIKKLKKIKYTEIKRESLNNSPNIFITICGNNVLTIVLTDPVTTINIRNKEVADCYKDYFDMIWKKAKSD